MTIDLNSYKKIAADVEVENADAHNLIKLLMQGALDKIAIATGMLEHGDIPGKGENIGKAIDIVAHLRASLDLQKGGEVAAELERLYEYILRRLLHANQTNNVAVLQEVSSLISRIKEGWDGIPDEIQRAFTAGKLSKQE